VLFTMPQYFQGVAGTDAMGSGLRLLPLVGGLILGAVPADQIARRAGAKMTAAFGFAILAAGLALGSTTSLSSPGSFASAWLAVAGVGVGLAMATVASAALSELPEARSGVGAAVLQALNKTGGPLGSAILGSIISSAYVAHLNLTGLPAAAAGAARQSIFGAVAVAQQSHSAALLDSARTAFVTGIDSALVVSACIALLGAALAAMFLPRGSAAADTEPGQAIKEPDIAAVR